MSKSYDWQSCYNQGVNSARVVMRKLKSAGHIHHYEEKTDGVSQGKQRDFLVWFKNGLEKPSHVEVKSEKWQLVNIAIELIHDIEQNTPGKHISFDNDYYLHYMVPDNLAVKFDCKPLRDNFLLPLLEKSDDFVPTQRVSFAYNGLQLKLTYPKTYRAGTHTHTSCTLIAPKELVEEHAGGWTLYEL